MPEYQKFIPFYVWLSKTCELVKIGVDEREIESKIIVCNEEIEELTNSIDKE